MNMFAPFHTLRAQDPNFSMLPPLAEAAARAVCAKVQEACPSMVRTHLLSILSSAVAPLYTVTPPNWTPITNVAATACELEASSLRKISAVRWRCCLGRA